MRDHLMRDHLKHMAAVRPQGFDRNAAVWALDEIERLEERVAELLIALDGERQLRERFGAAIDRQFGAD